MVPILVVVIINAWLFAGSVEVVGNRWGLTQTFIGMVIIPLGARRIRAMMLVTLC
jgi:Ca2+/H+ antiporter